MIAVREKELGTSEGAGMSGRDRVAALLQLLGREHKVLLPRILWVVAKGKLENGKAEAAPLSETTATAARTAAAATGSLKTAAAVRPAVAQPLTGAAAFAPVLRLEQDGLTDG